jgi:hypothetical protein
MIGVIADPADEEVVREFFELFKTPWEFYRRDQRYDVLLCAGEGQFDGTARITIFYAGGKTHHDDEQHVPTSRQSRDARILLYQGKRIPIYGDTITFSEKSGGLLQDEGSHECMTYLDRSRDRVLVRIGYDLFSEVRSLLTVGQPPANASMPALELHIAVLRDLITGSGVPLVEIPPVPDGYGLIACLTHDVDHPSIRHHKLDHTIVGFLLRATFGSLVDTLLGRMSIRDAIRNWAAVVKLPLVHLGLAKDFWRDFDARYLELEDGLPSTFFVIPRKNYAGRRGDGSAPLLRGARYGAQELADSISKLRIAGREVGLHGIDAWLDGSAACEELEEVRRLTGVSEIGVRMHWLYYNEKSPATLEKAGAAYDSTIGYNETVGYRAGTTQVYKPLGANQLLELPLHVMDTALFYLSYLGLSPRKATARLREMADKGIHYGGCITINWHDRSLAPERLWGACYRELIQDLKTRGAWFATAGQAVSWFRKRRAAAFETDSIEPGSVRAKVAPCDRDDLPGLRLRLHNARTSGPSGLLRSMDFVDVKIDKSIESGVASEAKR